MRLRAERIPATTRAFAIAGFAAVAVLIAAWWLGPGVFTGEPAAEREVTASVTEPVSCDANTHTEKVRFTDGGKTYDASLQACGHDKGEELVVTVPETLGSGALTVRSAGTHTGQDDVRRSAGLLLIALSCVAGGFYAFLVSRRSGWVVSGYQG